MNITSEIEKHMKVELKDRTYFYYKEKILFEESDMIEYKNYKMPLDISRDNVVGTYKTQQTKELVDNLKKQICGFLNNKGGRLFIGINDSRIIEGCRLTEREKDFTRNDISNFLSDFHPKCRTEKIKVVYVPVKNKQTDEFIPNMFVIKIIVTQGDPWRLYSVSFKTFKSYMRMDGQCVEMTAIEIEDNIIKRSLLQKKPLDLKEFEDPEPEIVVIKEQMEANLQAMMNANVPGRGRFKSLGGKSRIRKNGSTSKKKSSPKSEVDNNLYQTLSVVRVEPKETINPNLAAEGGYYFNPFNPFNNIIQQPAIPLTTEFTSYNNNQSNNLQSPNQLQPYYKSISLLSPSSVEETINNSDPQTSYSKKKEQLEKIKNIEKQFKCEKDENKPVKVIISKMHRDTTIDDVLQFLSTFNLYSNDPIDIKYNPYLLYFTRVYMLNMEEAQRLLKEKKESKLRNVQVEIEICMKGEGKKNV